MDKKRKGYLAFVYGGVLLILLGVFIVLSVLLFSNDEASQQLGAPQSTTVPNTIASETTMPDLTEPPTTEPPTTEPSEAEKLLLQMTRWEKIGQLFMVRPEMLVLTQPGTTENKSGFKTVTALMKEALAEYPVGGFALFNRNLQSPSQIKKFNADLQAASKIPLFIAIDEEGGRIARIANNKGFSVKKYNSAAAVGATGNSANALEMGKTIGAYLKNYGFNMNFAPVADVYTNPKNTVIGDRAFSGNPTVVAKMAAAMAQGLRQKGITPVYKHFPGHGDTAEDSHYEIAVSNKTLDEMMACEWLPFCNATEDDLVMLAHVTAPKITGDMTPATLSYKLVTECLRTKCGFSGLIITDSFAMDAIKNTYGVGEAAVMAFQAGCDIVLMPEDVKACFEAVEQALDNGELTENWLDNTVLRILAFKLQHGVEK